MAFRSPHIPEIPLSLRHPGEESLPARKYVQHIEILTRKKNVEEIPPEESLIPLSEGLGLDSDLKSHAKPGVANKTLPSSKKWGRLLSAGIVDLALLTLFSLFAILSVLALAPSYLQGGNLATLFFRYRLYWPFLGLIFAFGILYYGIGFRLFGTSVGWAFCGQHQENHSR